jgi:hypothetical protein
MCFGGGSSSGTKYQYYINSNGQTVAGETGLPQAAIDQGYTTVADWQYAEQNAVNDKSYKQTQDISDKQNAYNEKVLQYTKDTDAETKKQSQEQSDRQTTWDQGRAKLLSEGQQKVNDAFAQFTPDYFKGYTDKYLAQAADDIAYQKLPAQKQMAFGLARRGVIDSQSGINQAGVISEEEGRALAKSTQDATDSTNALRSKVSNAKSNLLGEVLSAESIGSPIAAGTTAGVTTNLDTTSKAISGVTNSAGDVTASISGVPTVSTVSNIFGGALSAAGSYLGGTQAAAGLNRYNTALSGTGLSGTNPFGK